MAEFDDGVVAVECGLHLDQASLPVRSVKRQCRGDASQGTVVVGRCRSRRVRRTINRRVTRSAAGPGRVGAFGDRAPAAGV